MNASRKFLLLYERFEIIKTRNNLLEFMPKGLRKPMVFPLLAKDLGIRAEEIMTLGDEENDLPMIEYAGLGVAMANAIPLVKEAADVVTDTNDQDGVAKAVEKYILTPLEGYNKNGIFDKIKSFSAEKKEEEKQEIIEETVDETPSDESAPAESKRNRSRRGANNARNDSGRSHKKQPI